MLMRPVEDVIKEAARVLKPGGIFAAVVGRVGKPCGIDMEVSKLLAPYFEANKPDFLIPGFGDSRIVDQEACRRLFAQDGNFNELKYLEFQWLMPMSLEDFMNFLRRTYVWFVIPEESHAEITQQVAHIWHDNGPDRQTVSINMRRISTTKHT